MKLLALRVSQFRRFAGPVAIEGLGDGVNVLAGPNEMGKSTLFHALEAAFLLRHRTSGALLDQMRPRSGGEPCVEVDFEVRGRRLRLRKQFGRGASSVLSDLGTGRIIAQAADAEEKVLELTGRKSELPGRLGLIWVRQKRSLLSADPDLDPDTGKQKPRGEEDALVDLIGEEVEAAAGGETFNAVQRLIDAAREVHLTGTRGAVKKNSPLDLARRVREAKLAELAEAERAAAAGKDRIEKIAALSAELAELDTQIRSSDIQSKATALEAQIAQAAKLRAARDVAREAEKAAAAVAVAARQDREAFVVSQRRRAEMDTVLRSALDIERDIAARSAALNADPATPSRIDRLLSLDRDLALANATLAAEAAGVEIALRPGHGNRVAAGGDVVHEDTRIAVPGSLDIDIDGIAQIRVTAGGARARGALDKRASAEADIAALLSALGVATVDEAKSRAAARAAQVDALEQARARLSGLAPKGAASIAAEIALNDKAAPGEADAGALQARAAEADAALAGAREARQKLELDAPSDESVRGMSSELQRLKLDAQTRAERRARVHVGLEKLKSEQEGADEDGRAGRAELLRGEMDLASAEVKRLEAEVAALDLLSSTLASIEAKQRQTFFAPVVQRLAPHLQALFGAATAQFGEGFTLSGLTRDGEAESVLALSDGTREQLSVLVRLSFAELIASRGEGAPLILDDPLVYSDDQRLEAMCRILGAAGERLQILLLTCRAEAFKKLPGRRLQVVPWRPGL